MNGQIKKYIYIIITICIVFFVGVLFIKMLPWLLLVGFVTYGVMKIVGFAKGKKQPKNPNNFDFNKKDDNVDSYKMSTDDYTNGEVIDVEYEDVDNKKD